MKFFNGLAPSNKGMVTIYYEYSLIDDIFVRDKLEIEELIYIISSGIGGVFWLQQGQTKYRARCEYVYKIHIQPSQCTNENTFLWWKSLSTAEKKNNKRDGRPEAAVGKVAEHSHPTSAYDSFTIKSKNKELARA